MRQVWISLLSALFLTAAALGIGVAGANHIREATARGYVDVGMSKCRNCEMLWQSRHTRAESPWRFYATLSPWISFSVGFGCAAVGLWIGLIWKLPLPEGIGLWWFQQTVLAVGAAGMMLGMFFIIPLK